MGKKIIINNLFKETKNHAGRKFQSQRSWQR